MAAFSALASPSLTSTRLCVVLLRVRSGWRRHGRPRHLGVGGGQLTRTGELQCRRGLRRSIDRSRIARAAKECAASRLRLRWSRLTLPLLLVVRLFSRSLTSIPSAAGLRTSRPTLCSTPETRRRPTSRSETSSIAIRQKPTHKNKLAASLTLRTRLEPALQHASTASGCRLLRSMDPRLLTLVCLPLCVGVCCAVELRLSARVCRRWCAAAPSQA